MFKNRFQQMSFVIDCRMLVLLPIFLITLAAKGFSEFTQECIELFAPYRPWNCCEEYPAPKFDNETVAGCVRKCDDKKDDVCCMLDCYTDSSGIYEQEKLNIDKLVDILVYDYDENMQQIWSTETKKSIETCEKLSKFINYFLHDVN